MKIFIALFVFTISCVSTKQKQDCGQYRTGFFYFYSKPGRDLNIVDRKDSIQIEKNKKNGITIKKLIKWIDSCTYELHFISGKSGDTLSDGSIRIVESSDKIQKVRIISAAVKYYIFETSDKNQILYSDTMWIGKPIGGFKSMGKI